MRPISTTCTRCWGPVHTGLCPRRPREFTRVVSHRRFWREVVFGLPDNLLIPEQLLARAQEAERRRVVKMRRALVHVTTGGLDKRSKVAKLTAEFKAEVRRDLGGDLTRAQEAILELAARD